MVGVLVVRLTDTSGQLTVIAIGPALLLPLFVSLLALTVAVLLMPGQLAAVVTAFNTIAFDVPAAIVPKLQVSVVPPATGEVGAHAVASGPATVQLSPLGSASVRMTLAELPLPPAVTVML